MTDPFAYFPRDGAGKLLPGLYRRIPAHLIWDALRLGWVPAPPRWPGPYELEMIWCFWIDYVCGRKMRVPR